MLRLVGLQLKKAGYQVLYAGDGLTSVAKAHKEQPDLIILDVRMPAGDGFSVIERLRKSTETWHIPIIIVSSDSREVLGDLLDDSSISRFLQKPVEAHELLMAVHEELDD